MNRDMIFAFIGGAIVGASGAVAVLNRMGYVKLTEEQKDILLNEPGSMFLNGMRDGLNSVKEDPDILQSDKVSYTQPSKIDPYKVRYDTLEDKPDLDEMVKKYEEEEEYEDEENDGDPYPDLADVIQTSEEDIDYGHTITQLPARRKDQLIFLVHQDYAGECYLLEDLIYYEKDDILTDVTDAPVDDVLGVIGDSLGYFGKYSEDSDKLFVRNCTMGLEYEVTRVHTHYAEKLYGIDSGEEVLKTKKIKRKVKDDDE